ncbi:MAG: dockerin type I domain-containing protein [Planctomycetota bacterium]
MFSPRHNNYCQGIGAALLLGALSPAAAAAPFTEGLLDNGDATIAIGQSFGPGIDPLPSSPGLGLGDPVLLTGFELASGGGGVGDAETRLAILPGAFYDFNGDPDGTFSPTVADALGVSDNSFDTTSLAYGDALAYTFGAGLEVAFGDVLSAVLVTVDPGTDVITPLEASVAFIRFFESSPGVFDPAANYGGTDNFDAGGLFGPLTGDGFAVGSFSATDLSFVATFVEATSGLEGDANGDGVVDLLDFDILAGHFGSATGNGITDGDFNEDGVVDLLDFDILAGNFGASSPAALLEAVPEPASLGVLGVGAVVCLRRRKPRG